MADHQKHPSAVALVRALLATIGLATAIGLAASLLAAPVLAHAVFVSASPAPGARLDTAPTSVRIVFSEPLNPGLSGITILHSAGTAVQALGGGVDPSDGRAFEVRLPALPPDRYTVAWHTVSLVDGHTRTGSYPFTVLEPGGAVPPVSASAQPPLSQPPTIPDPLLALAAWTIFGGFALVAAALVASLARRRPAAADQADLRRTYRLLLALGAAVALAGSAMALAWALVPTGGVAALGSVLGSTFGAWWIVRSGALVVLLAAAARPAVLDGRRRVTLGLAASLAVAVTATAATSHGAAASEAAWGFAFDLAHLTGVTAWIGAVIALALAFRGPERDDEAQAAYRLDLLRRVSVIAGVAVPLVLLSGLGSALIELASPDDLVDTGYGRALVLKLAIGAGLLAVAGLNALWLRPSAARSAPSRRRLRSTVAVEVALGIAVIGVAALVSVRVPARAADATQAAVEQVAADEDPASSFAGTTSVEGAPAEVTVTPALLGRNVVRVETARDMGASLVAAAIDPAGHATSTALTRTGTSLQADGSLRTVYGGSAVLDGPAGSWQVRLAEPGGSADGAPLLLPLAAGAAAAPDTAPAGPPVAWLAILALATAGVVVIASSRGVGPRGPRRAVIALGAVTFFVASGVGGVLAVIPPAGSAGWGTQTAVQPSDTGVATVWSFPAANAGLMMPIVGPDGSIWVPEMNVNRLAALDPATRTLRELTFPTPIRSTMGAAMDSVGVIWLAQESPDALGRFDPATGAYTEVRLPTPAASPSGLVIGPDGAVWFTELGGDKIGRYEPATGAFTEYALTAGSVPFWLALGPDGRVWVTELQSDRIAVVTPSSGAVRELPTPGQGTPTGIAVDGSGTVWFVTSEGLLVTLDPTSLAMRVVHLPMGIDYGVAIAPGGTIWIGSIGDMVASYDPTDGHFTTYTFATDSGPWWPVVAPDGSVWVALSSQHGNGLAHILPR